MFQIVMEDESEVTRASRSLRTELIPSLFTRLPLGGTQGQELYSFTRDPGIIFNFFFSLFLFFDLQLSQPHPHKF